MGPQPVSLEHYLSGPARRRKANVYKLFYKYQELPGISDLSGGLPHPSLFPIDWVQAETADPERLENPSAPEHIVSASHRDLENGLQYGKASGLQELAEWIRKFTYDYIATPLYEPGFETLITSGTTDGWSKVLQVLSNEWDDEGDVNKRQGILVEEFTYSCAAEAARVRGLNVVSVAMDQYGMLPDALYETLANWDSTKGKRPHLLYTVSIGQNPTGATTPLSRRKELYKILSDFDVIIAEDEPYWFLQYSPEKEKCYLQIDIDGRVIRLDSFSKNFAPGSRLGWVTAQPSLIRRLYYQTEEVNAHPSGFSQLIVLKTLKNWGHAGWMNWLESLEREYHERRDLLCRGLEKWMYMGAERILDYSPPQAGMFVWVLVHFEHHPLYEIIGSLNLSRAFWMFQTEQSRPTLVSPGYMFAPVPDDADHMARYFRISFAPSDKQDLEESSNLVGEAAHKFWNVTDPARMTRLSEAFPIH